MSKKNDPLKRRADESPVDYYKRTKHVDEHFERKFRGLYYCNPAHCERTFKSRSGRNKHLAGAYEVLK